MKECRKAGVKKKINIILVAGAWFPAGGRGSADPRLQPRFHPSDYLPGRSNQILRVGQISVGQPPPNPPRVGLSHQHIHLFPEFKETVSQDFLLLFFLWLIFPQAFDNSIRVLLNFIENSRRYFQVKVHHRYQRHWRQICHQPILLVLLIPTANLPPVSTTPVANNGNTIRLLTP